MKTLSIKKSVGWSLAALSICSMMSSPARADRCNADATNTNFHSISGNKYVFAFDVTASGCDSYPCRGWVHTAIRYHYQGDTQTLVDRTLVQFKIDRGSSRTHVSLDEWVGAVSSPRTVVDDVATEEVTCTTP
jgi:hypothetical protein